MFVVQPYKTRYREIIKVMLSHPGSFFSVSAERLLTRGIVSIVLAGQIFLIVGGLSAHAQEKPAGKAPADLAQDWSKAKKDYSVLDDSLLKAATDLKKCNIDLEQAQQQAKAAPSDQQTKEQITKLTADRDKSKEKYNTTYKNYETALLKMQRAKTAALKGGVLSLETSVEKVTPASPPSPSAPSVVKTIVPLTQSRTEPWRPSRRQMMVLVIGASLWALAMTGWVVRSEIRNRKLSQVSDLQSTIHDRKRCDLLVLRVNYIGHATEPDSAAFMRELEAIYAAAQEEPSFVAVMDRYMEQARTFSVEQKIQHLAPRDRRFERTVRRMEADLRRLVDNAVEVPYEPEAAPFIDGEEQGQTEPPKSIAGNQQTPAPQTQKTSPESKKDQRKAQQQERDAKTREKAQKEQFDQTLRGKEAVIRGKDAELIRRREELDALRKERDALQRKQEAFQEYAELTAMLRESKDRLPVGSQEFLTMLLSIAEEVNKKDLRSLSKRQDMERLDLYVYRPPLVNGWLAQEQENPVKLEDLLQVVALQAWVHRSLDQQGLVVIRPAVGDAFDPETHNFADQDLVWINDNRSLDNKIASVKRIGYRRGETVIRKADVKRYVFSATSVPSPQEGSSSLVPNTTKPNVPAAVPPQDQVKQESKSGSTESEEAALLNQAVYGSQSRTNTDDRPQQM